MTAPTVPPAARTAVVLAAGAVPALLRPFVGQTSAALLPVNGRPVIHWSLEYLHDHGVERVVVGMRDDDTRLERFLEHAFGSRLDIVPVRVSEDRGPGFTLLHCLRHVQESEPVLVVLGDTLFRFPAEPWEARSGSFVLTGPVHDTLRWCLADVSDEGLVVALEDKPAENPGAWPALIGVYHLADPRPALEALAAVSATEDQLELRHALAPYVARGALHARSAGDWFDCGNPDNLVGSRRRLLQARSFNSLVIDDVSGTLTKRSADAGKLLEEISYYLSLPDDLKIFFPRLVAHDTAPDAPSLTLEYYGYWTLSEIWVFESFEVGQWGRTFTTLARILDHFAAHTALLSPGDLNRFYRDKTVERVEALAAQSPQLKALVEAREVRLNGRTLQGWPALAPRLEGLVSGLASTARGQAVHGDLCFTNILMDPLSGLIKFIDPRGRFGGETGVYGDPRYDVAKLLHSMDGGYDQLIHGMYDLRMQGVDFTLRQFFPAERASVLRAFADVFGPRADLGEARLIEGLLFLSMGALHPEDRRRQAGMFVVGLRILNDVLEGKDLFASLGSA